MRQKNERPKRLQLDSFTVGTNYVPTLTLLLRLGTMIWQREFTNDSLIDVAGMATLLQFGIVHIRIKGTECINLNSTATFQEDQ